MNISVENLSTVDKKIILEADSSDIEPKITKALRQYSKTMNFPGFRAGKAPMSLVKKRIGKEVEGEQIDKLIQDVFQETIVPEHKPIGEPVVEKMDYTDGKLYVEFLIGVSPEIELVDLSTVEIDKLVHDVTDEEVEKEYTFSIRRHSEWKESDEPATADSKVTVDVVKLDDEGNPTADHDHDLELDLSSEQNKEYADALSGKKQGEEATITIDEDGEKAVYTATIKKVENQVQPELNEEFFKKASRDAATNEEDFKNYLKNQIQNYFDQTSDDLFHDKIAGALIDKHDFEVPKSILNEILKNRIQALKSENDNKLPDDFNQEAYEEENRESILKEAKWSFLVTKLMDKYPEIEINSEDVDAFFETEAAKMGLPAEMLRNFYSSQSSQIENLRMRIRTNKLFAKLADEVTAVELDRKTFEDKYSNKNNG